jgi:hypothetical protein
MHVFILFVVGAHTLEATTAEELCRKAEQGRIRAGIEDLCSYDLVGVIDPGTNDMLTMTVMSIGPQRSTIDILPDDTVISISTAYFKEKAGMGKCNMAS